MIGLLFFGAIGLWLLVAFYLGVKLPQWLKLKPVWTWLFVPLMIFAPVMDEVIALPQAYTLCKQSKEAFWYDKNVKGGILNYSSQLLSNSQIIIGFNIKAKIINSAHVLKSDGRAVIKNMEVDFSPGLLNTILWGSTGHAIILPESCPGSSWAIPKYQSTIKLLELSRESNPIFNQESK